MSKYSSELKALIVSEHLAGKSSSELADDYHVPRRRINKWIQLFWKGRPPKVNKKHSKKHVRHLAEKNEIDRLKEELAKKNQELHETKLELEITKKSLTLFGPSKHAPKHK